jgi:hypothetical protein
MNRERLRELLEALRRGEVEVDDALEDLARLPFVDVPDARVDTHRALRQGLPEVVYGRGKSPEQIVAIVRALRESDQDVLVTRVEPDVVERLRPEIGACDYDPLSRLLWSGPAEVAQVARRFGNKVETLPDVGVAGIHRLLASSEVLRAARVLIVVAGMEGALPSVVGGMVDKPVIAVPTSVGYGAAFGGIAALLGMLTSCASNVTVVNIDNGFGAAYVATLINRL